MVAAVGHPGSDEGGHLTRECPTAKVLPRNLSFIRGRRKKSPTAH